MCGRMNISDHEGIRSLLESLGMETWPTQQPSYNVAPTQSLDVITMVEDQPELTAMNWGISMKSKGKKGQPITRRIPNSRDDKVWNSYLWRYLIPQQRALIPVNGFYEWKRKNKKLVAAYHITPAGRPAMFFAGIYRKSKHEEPCEVSIITTSANDSMGKVHDRMPVILTSQNAAMAWIQESDRQSLDELMQPAQNEALVFTQVSDFVNKSTNDGPECIEAVIS